MSQSSSRARNRRAPEQERSRALVDAVLVAAERVLGEVSLDDASMARIAEVAGVSVGSIYQYFPSKNDLVAALIERTIDQGSEAMMQLARHLDGHPLDVCVGAMVTLLVDYFRSDRKLFANLLDVMGKLERERYVRSELEGCIRATEAVLGAVQPPLTVDVATAAWLLTIAANSVVHDAVSNRPASLDDGTLHAALHRLCWTYLTAPPQLVTAP